MIEKLLYTAAVPFEAARRVACLPQGHRSGRLHGHSFLAKIRAALPTGWAAFPGGEVGQLRDHLRDTVALLDYECLNEHLSEPTDENLARWIREKAGIPGTDVVGIQSTVDEGVDLDSSQRVHIWRRHSLESAHFLPNVPQGHKCGRMHGHGFQVIIHANQDLGERDISLDYDLLDAVWTPLYAELDHTCLNDIPGLENPTSEMIARWLWHRLKPQLTELSWITVYETAQCGATFDGTRYRIWKEMTFDSALRLCKAPEGDSRRRLHGHTYTLRLHIDAPLDIVMGWTIDFGDVKELFAPIFRSLDHQPLHEVAGLGHADSASLARWIRSAALRVLPQIDRIDLYETRGSGVVLAAAASDVALPI